MLFSANLCNILICGFDERCGFNVVHTMILDLVNNNKLRYFTADEINIVKSSNFFNVYSQLKHFHYIILCRRNVLSLTNDKSKLHQYIEEYNCWTLFASVIIPYEDSYKDIYDSLYRTFNTLDPIVENDEDQLVLNSKKLINFMRSNGYEKHSLI